jgi:hypothetical protein
VLYWGSPVPGLCFNATVFLSADALGRHRPTTPFYFDAIGRSNFLNGATQPKLATPVRARDASTYFDRALIGERFIKVAEAAIAVDPLSSSGFQIAIQSEITASVTVNTLLSRPHSTELALRFYRNSQRETCAGQAAWACGELFRISAVQPHRVLARQIRQSGHKTLPRARSRNTS